CHGSRRRPPHRAHADRLRDLRRRGRLGARDPAYSKRANPLSEVRHPQSEARRGGGGRMKAVAATFVETVLPAEVYLDRQRSASESRFADYLQLIRPRVAVMVLVTVALGGWLAAPGVVPPTAL